MPDAPAMPMRATASNPTQAFPWALYLAEVVPEEGALPEGFAPFHGRVLFRPVQLTKEQLRQVVRIGEDPLIGPVYARPVASGGTLAELHAHPLFERALASRKTELAQHFVQSRLEAVEELRAWFRRYGLEGLLEEILEEHRQARMIYLALEGTGVPIHVREGKVWVTGDPPLEVRDLEEATRLAELYRWGRVHRVPIACRGRNEQGQPRFEVGAYLLRIPQEGPLQIPVAQPLPNKSGGITPVVFVRNGKGKLQARALPPTRTRQFQLFFLPPPR